MLPRPESGLKEYLTSRSCPHPGPSGGGGRVFTHKSSLAGHCSAAAVGGQREQACPRGLGLELLGASGESVAAGSQEVALQGCEGDLVGQGAPLGPPGEQPLGPQPRAQSLLGGSCGHATWHPQVFTGPKSGVWGPVGEEGQGNQRLLGLGPMTQVQVRGWPQVWARLGCTVWGCWGMQVAQLEEACPGQGPAGDSQ